MNRKKADQKQEESDYSPNPHIGCSHQERDYSSNPGIRGSHQEKDYSPNPGIWCSHQERNYSPNPGNGCSHQESNYSPNPDIGCSHQERDYSSKLGLGHSQQEAGPSRMAWRRVLTGGRSHQARGSPSPEVWWWAGVGLAWLRIWQSHWSPWGKCRRAGRGDGIVKYAS